MKNLTSNKWSGLWQQLKSPNKMVYKPLTLSFLRSSLEVFFPISKNLALFLIEQDLRANKKSKKYREEVISYLEDIIPKDKKVLVNNGTIKILK